MSIHKVEEKKKKSRSSALIVLKVFTRYLCNVKILEFCRTEKPRIKTLKIFVALVGCFEMCVSDFEELRKGLFDQLMVSLKPEIRSHHRRHHKC